MIAAGMRLLEPASGGTDEARRARAAENAPQAVERFADANRLAGECFNVAYLRGLQTVVADEMGRVRTQLDAERDNERAVGLAAYPLA